MRAETAPHLDSTLVVRKRRRLKVFIIYRERELFTAKARPAVGTANGFAGSP
jgi:hypothetical protein